MGLSWLTYILSFGANCGHDERLAIIVGYVGKIHGDLVK
jgi:hypothetical protein